MPATRTLRFIAIAWMTVMCACTPVSKLPGTAQQPYPPAEPPQAGQIVHLPTGFEVTEEQMLSMVADARIAYVGETHDNPASHRLELAVLRAMQERYPAGVALGMEMFTPEDQPEIDTWLAGGSDDRTFLKRTRLEERWGWDHYREILLFARENGIPVIGLNATEEQKGQVSSTDFADLTEDERSKLPQIVEDPYQRALTEGIFQGHGMGSADIDGFQRVQTLWDETMAENVASYLKSPEGAGRRMVVIAGGNHVRYGFGIPRRVFRRLPLSYALLGTAELEIPEEKKARLMNVSLPDFPMPPYHFLVYGRYEIYEKPGVRLGVMLKPDGNGAEIRMAVEGSPAAEAGLLAGDIITTLDGVLLEDAFDLKWALREIQPGGSTTLGITRGEESLELEVLFPLPDASPAP